MPASKAKRGVKTSTRKAPAARKAVKRASAGKKVSRKAPAPQRGVAKRVARKVGATTAKPAAPKASSKKASSKKASSKKASSKQASSKKALGLGKATPARDARQALTQKRVIAAALSPATDGKQIVDAYLRDVDHPFKAEMQAVREIILGVSSKISERIKWNAPSFYYKEDLGAFNPRATEYAHLILVFPDGRGMQDGSGILEGQHKDRREVKFHGMDDVKKKKSALEKVVKSWVALRG